MTISDERLAELVSKLEAHVGKLTEVQDDKCIIAALRELQQLREAVREIRSADPSPTQIEAWCVWVHERLSKAACPAGGANL